MSVSKLLNSGPSPSLHKQRGLLERLSGRSRCLWSPPQRSQTVTQAEVGFSVEQLGFESSTLL